MVVWLIVVDDTLAKAEEVEVSKGAEAWGEGRERSSGVLGERHYDAEEQEEEGHLLDPAQAFYRPCKSFLYPSLQMVQLQCWKSSL